MEGTRRLSLVVGAFVLLATGALVVTILALSSQQGTLQDRYNLEVYFPSVAGLVPNAAVWLASDEASFVTGEAIVVDGGLRAQSPLGRLGDPRPARG